MRLLLLATAALLTAACTLTLAGTLAFAAEEPAEPKGGKEPATKEVEAGDLTLVVPETWEQGEPSSKFRKVQFDVPAVKGDKEPGEYVVFHFGEGGGGGVQANVQRWIGQFRADGRKVKVFTGTSKAGKYTLIDLTGTYNKPEGPPVLQKTTPMPGARMLGVVLQNEKGGDYFIKFTGPEKTIAAAAADFRNSFGGDAKTEKEAKQTEEKPDAP